MTKDGIKKKTADIKAYAGDPDRRIIGKDLREKHLTEGELKAYLDKLPDVSENADTFVVEMNDRS